MKIEYLGTAAYEGVPSPFCRCEVCKKSRALGWRNIRSRSQALVNDELLLDFNADTVSHYHRYGFDFERLCACLITHSHCDHLYTDDIEIAAECYSHEHRTLNFYAARSGYDMIRSVAYKTGGGVSVTLVEAGKRFAAGDGRYSVMPMNANHMPQTSPVIYSIACEGKRMLYAHDTGVFPEDTWELLEKEGRFDLVSIDCTGCLGLGGDWVDGHMSLGSVLKVLERMRSLDLIDGDTVVVANHFSHNGGQTYDEMCAAAEKYGIVVSYDGLTIEF